VQMMVRSDLASSGVMFTLDTETGFPDVVFITGAYGLGENVVQGAVDPDEFYVHKPMLADGRPAVIRRSLGSKLQKMVFGAASEAGRSTRVIEVERADADRFSLTDPEVTELARYAVAIEKHYGRPMDIEWARDGVDGKLYVLQARPETVKSRKREAQERYTLKSRSKTLATGRAIGHKIGAGTVRIVKDASRMSVVKEGDVLVTDMTDPDWEPIMKRASAIVTNRGGRTCHAAIIARELGIPAVVGCGDASERIPAGAAVTVSCAEGDTGLIFEGELDFEQQQIELDAMPTPPVRIMMNVGNPDRAFDFAAIPNTGVGLARLEFIINRMVGVHPRALLEFDAIDDETRSIIRQQMFGYTDPQEFFVTKLSEGIATIAAAFEPNPVIVRLSDFKSNEYANLIGGARYEPTEENPMLGFRGASRYYADAYRAGFALECRAIRRLRNEMGFRNVIVMIPFCRTPGEADKVLAVMAENGLARGRDGLEIYVMCEIPSNVILARGCAARFDGFSIGSNDLTQYLLAVDRNNARVAGLYHAYHPAVLRALQAVVDAAHAEGKPVSICGELAGDPGAALLLVAMGYDMLSMSATNLARVKSALRRFTLGQAQELLEDVSRLDDPAAVRSSVEDRLRGEGVSVRPRTLSH